MGSRWLYRIDHYSSQPIVAVTAIVLLISALIIGIALGFPARWVTAFETATSGAEGSRRTFTADRHALGIL